ncbi:MAPK kinase substrate protein At1g80180-like [Tasmannia lanceolata]|uniref:MAPK kinase substrate protein At1g80180-like n=1 Tax=Tasmannia lanceolata TaxID=3420 RepID=UPI0040643ADC
MEREKEHMAGLQRSAVSFRRTGSSGLIWEDRFFSGELGRAKKEEEDVEFKELRPCQSVGSIGMMERCRSGGGRSSKVDPPSPKGSGCGFCGVFGKSSNRTRPKSRK